MAPHITWEYDYHRKLARATNTDEKLVLFADGCGRSEVNDTVPAWAVSWTVPGVKYQWDSSGNARHNPNMTVTQAEMKSLALAIRMISHLYCDQRQVFIFNDSQHALCKLQKWDRARDAHKLVHNTSIICREFWQAVDAVSASARAIPIAVCWIPHDKKRGIFGHEWADFAANLASGRGGRNEKYYVQLDHLRRRDEYAAAVQSAGVLDPRMRPPTDEELFAWLAALDAEFQAEKAAIAAAATSLLSPSPAVSSASSTLSLPPPPPPATSVKRARARDEGEEGEDGASHGQLPACKHERMG